MPDIQPSAARANDPARIITEAINAAIDRGLTVSSNPDLGVLCTSTQVPEWERDPRASSISPLGAVLLVQQPHVPEPVAALAEALGVRQLWAEGFDHGCAGDSPNPNLQEGLDGWLYADGYVAGCETRVMLQRAETRIAKLVREVKAEPKKLIPALLASLQPSQVLAMLAEAQRERATTLGGAAHDHHMDAARDLADLAENFKADGL